jgi:membrane associated rhomboid family serine protease
MVPGTRRTRLALVLVLLGSIVGAVIGVGKGEGIGGIVIEAVTSGFIAGAVVLAMSIRDKPGRRGD